MKIALKFEWYTDGDWRVDIEDIKKETSTMTEIAKIHFDNEDDDSGIGAVSFLIDDEVLGAQQEALSIASHVTAILLCSIRVLWTHYYVLEEIYALFEKLRKFLQQTRSCIRENKEYTDMFYAFMTGNYDDTAIQVAIQN